jgi:hypothetical protein
MITPAPVKVRRECHCEPLRPEVERRGNLTDCIILVYEIASPPSVGRKEGLAMTERRSDEHFMAFERDERGKSIISFRGVLPQKDDVGISIIGLIHR